MKTVRFKVYRQVDRYSDLVRAGANAFAIAREDVDGMTKEAISVMADDCVVPHKIIAVEHAGFTSQLSVNGFAIWDVLAEVSDEDWTVLAPTGDYALDA